eukprot:IDg1471t1
MKIVSWNVNGLRALPDFRASLTDLDADVLCVQETRLAGASDPLLEQFALVPGYSSYFSFCNVRSGYSGVATFVRDGALTPVDAGEGLCNSVGGAASKSEPESGPKHELGASVGDAPNGTARIWRARCARNSSDVLAALRARAIALTRAGRQVVMAGDFNVIPAVVDTADVVPPSQRLEWLRSPSRSALRRLQVDAGLVDAFRISHPAARDAYTCWHTQTRARENNAGVRIDFVLMSQTLAKAELSDSAVHADVHGSDHAPTSATLKHAWYDDEKQRTRSPPRFCARFLPQLARTQASILSSFLPVRAAKGAALSRSVFDMCLPSAGATRTPVPSPKRLRTPKPATSVKRGRAPESADEEIVRPTERRKQQRIDSFFRSAAQVRHSDGTSPQMGTDSQSIQSVRNAVAMIELADDAGKRPVNEHGKKHIVSEGERAGIGGCHKARKKAQWSQVFKRAPSAPLCRHGEVCKLKAVSKAGANKGRTFWSCCRASGKQGDREANCNFFQWAPFSAKKPLPGYEKFLVSNGKVMTNLSYSEMLLAKSLNGSGRQRWLLKDHTPARKVARMEDCPESRKKDAGDSKRVYEEHSAPKRGRG